MIIAPKKIAYITGSRADFGLMSPVLRAIDASEHLSLAVYATGMHLMPTFGETQHDVVREFPGTRRLEAVFRADDRTGMVHFAGELILRVEEAFTAQRPDLVLILGDRVEMLAITLACTYLRIPTAHLHGGEQTGTVDDLARNAISKMASIHFPATRASALRLRAMGEEEERIHVVGAPALDAIHHATLPTREELFNKLGLDAASPCILVVQHSASEEVEQAGAHMAETLKAVKTFSLPVVVIYPNADPGGQAIIREIEQERTNALFHIFPNVSYTDFLALEREASVIVGNSSGAIIESPSFGTPVVNIGTRQKGRERSGNIIDVAHSQEDIQKAITKSLSDATYVESLKRVQNLWGDGKTGERVVHMLEGMVLQPRLVEK